MLGLRLGVRVMQACGAKCVCTTRREDVSVRNSGELVGGLMSPCGCVTRPLVGLHYVKEDEVRLSHWSPWLLALEPLVPQCGASGSSSWSLLEPRAPGRSLVGWM